MHPSRCCFIRPCYHSCFLVLPLFNEACKLAHFSFFRIQVNDFEFFYICRVNSHFTSTIVMALFHSPVLYSPVGTIIGQHLIFPVRLQSTSSLSSFFLLLHVCHLRLYHQLPPLGNSAHSKYVCSAHKKHLRSDSAPLNIATLCAGPTTLHTWSPVTTGLLFMTVLNLPQVR